MYDIDEHCFLILFSELVCYGFLTLAQCPTLPKLLKFPCKGRFVNIISEIGAKYTTFGILLLNDQTGARITAIAQKHTNNAEHINIEVYGSGYKEKARNQLLGAHS